MKRVLVSFIILGVLLTASEAKLRHDRKCDIVQDHWELYDFNPEGGNAIMFGGCGEVMYTEPFDDPPRASWWGSFSCGYLAYRDDKKRDGSPYGNKLLTEFWIKGWNEAKKACTSGTLPFGLKQ